jgi:hypothetical protein
MSNDKNNKNKEKNKKDEEKTKKDMRKKSKITKMVLQLEEDNIKYIKRNDHILKGYIKIDEDEEEKKDQKEDKNEEEEEEESQDEDKNKKDDNKKNNKNKNKNTNEEKTKFLEDEAKEDENSVEVDIEKLSIVHKTKNIIIKLFYLLLPFEKDMKYIKYNYNTTVLLTFRIYRFLFLMSIITAIIFLILCIMHLVKNKQNLGEVCKYGIPCFLLYSSFNQNEALDISTTYGVWIMFYFICTMAYYFILHSEEYEKEMYYQNNNKLYTMGSYLASSWNFNCKNNQIANRNKESILNELQTYTKDYISKIEENEEDKCNYCLNILAHIVYIGFILVSFFIIIIFFFVREKMRSSDTVIEKLGAKDILADIITYLLIALFLYLIVWITGLFPRCEGWSNDRQKNMSERIKKLITTFVSLFSLLFIIAYCTLNANDNKKILPFLNVDHISFFGCPGKYEDHRHDNTFTSNTILNTFKEVSRKSYSQCREEDTGIAFLFIFLIYFIFIFIAETIKCLTICLCDSLKDITFKPCIDFIKYYTLIILYSLVIYYIPYFAFLFPIIMLVIYKFHFYILKRQGSYSFEETAINRRNNNTFILTAFIIFNIAFFCIIGYLYFAPFPHFYTVNCYTPKTKNDDSYNVMKYNETNWCGPVRSKEQLSSVLTNNMKDALFIGWFVGLFQQIPFVIILISILIIILVYRQYNPDIRYYDYLIKRQQDLSNTFHQFYEQISKRDILTSMLLKMTQQKLKSK